ncbi:MAG: hypothetical protein JNL82_04865 [Myxococcales bacterium]|nr:hypothetical protein [Myxococcales bacterium]
MLKKIGLALLLVLLIAAGLVYYLFYQATSLPDWYTAEAAEAPEPAVLPDGSLAWADAPAKAGATGQRKELRNFHKKAAKKHPEVAKVIKSSRASFAGGVLELGVVADLRNLPQDQLKGDQAEFFQKVRKTFPSATDREVYIGVEDPAPVFAGGRIELGPAAELRVGNLSYDLDAAAAKLGMTPAALRAQFNGQIHQLGVNPPTG